MTKLIRFLAVVAAATTVIVAQNRAPATRILKVGTMDVTGARLEVEDEAVDLTAEVSNYRGLRIVALAQPRGQRRYLVVGSPADGPGNIVTIGAVRFPARDCDLLLVTFAAPAPAPGEWLSEERVASAPARSDRVSIIASRPVAMTAGVKPDDEVGASLVIIAVDNKSLGAGDQVVAPVNTEVGVMAQLLPTKWHVNLRVRIPYTNICSIYNATRGGDAGNYIARDVNFDAVGDPLQDHFDVVAFASQEAYAVGRLACDTLHQETLISSATVHVTVDSKSRVGGPERVPYIRITRIGRENVGSGSTVATQQGASIEVGASERLTEGAMLTVWCGRLDSSTFLVSAPMVPRGGPAGLADGEVAVTWVLPSARFLSPAGTDSEGAADYRCMAVLSTTAFPETWLDGSTLSSHSIETVSEPVIVRVRNPEPDFGLSLSIGSLCGQEATDDNVVELRANCPVVVESRGAIPPGMRIFVGGHPTGDDSWTLVQAVPNGQTYTVPDFPLGGHAGATWQFVAVPSFGALPVSPVRYADFLPHHRITSEIATAIGRGQGGGAQQANNNEVSGSSPVEANSKSWGRRIMNTILLSILPLAFLAGVLVLLEWLFGVVSVVAGLAAEWLDQALAELSRQCEIPSQINVGRFLLGAAMAAFLSWLIVTQYLKLFTDVLATVTGVTLREGRGWARYLVVMAGLVGILIDLAHQLGKGKATGSGPNFYTVVHAVLSCAALVLWGFSACLYFEFLRTTSSGLVAPMGAIAAFLISMTETLGFYFATALTVDSFGWVAVRVLFAPFYLLVWILRLAKATFERRRIRHMELQAGSDTSGSPAFGAGD